jgi:hypothetical protein
MMFSIKQSMFLSTGTSDCRGGTGLKTVFASVCAKSSTEDF